MYYDDEARRFNFVSGLILGAVLGTGVALLISPREHLRGPRRIRKSTASARRGGAGRFAQVRKAVRESLAG